MNTRPWVRPNFSFQPTAFVKRRRDRCFLRSAHRNYRFPASEPLAIYSMNEVKS